MKRLDRKVLTMAQKRVVKRGLESGLTRLQVAYYSNPDFTPDQMEEIRLAFLDGLNASEIHVFADPRVSADEMCRIRNIYRESKTIRQKLKHLSDALSRV